MAASGNPKLIVEADGSFHLEADEGHGRVYVKACNYNSKTTGETMFEDGNIDDTNIKVRNRHQMGGDCDNRQGGIGCVWEQPNKIESKLEVCHDGGNPNTIDETTSKNME